MARQGTIDSGEARLLGSDPWRDATDHYPLAWALPLGLLAGLGTASVIALGLLAPQLALVAQVLRRRWLPAAATLVAALVGVGLIVAGDAASGYDAEHPRPDTLFYTLNADSGEAKWATLDPEPDEWTQQFLSEDAQQTTVGELYVGEDPTRVLASPAPVAPLRPPELELLGQERNGTTFTLRLRLSSPREAWRAYLLPGPGVKILGWGTNGRPPQGVEDVVFEHTPLPREGVDVTAKVRASGPIRFTVIDRTNGLPHIPGETIPPRPGSVMPAPLPPEAEVFAGYPTLVSRSFEWKARSTQDSLWLHGVELVPLAKDVHD